MKKLHFIHSYPSQANICIRIRLFGNVCGLAHSFRLHKNTNATLASLKLLALFSLLASFMHVIHRAKIRIGDSGFVIVCKNTDRQCTT